MISWRSFGCGLIGAGTLTILHEAARNMIPHAPRVDVLGMRALAQGMRATGATPPRRDRLYYMALVGDLLANGLYYSLAVTPSDRRTRSRGVLLGLLAGLGAVILPRPLGLGRQPGARFPLTHLLTIAWYLVGGIAAARVAQLWEE